MASLVLASGVSAQELSVAFDRPEYIVTAGTKVEGTIPVTNTADQPVAAMIYVGDWVRQDDDTTGYAFDTEGGNEDRSFLEWVTFSPERMTIDPHDTRDITYEINVPEDADLDGTYWGVFFIEGIPEEELVIPEAPDDETVAVGIRTVFRYAIQIFATIEDTEVLDAGFSFFNMEQKIGGFDAIATLENRGNTMLRPTVWLEVRNTAGEVVYEETHAEITILPESGRNYIFELRSMDVEDGDYLVMIIADYGVPGLVAAQGQISLTVDRAGDETIEDLGAAEE